jgi:hypothetical protein
MNAEEREAAGKTLPFFTVLTGFLPGFGLNTDEVRPDATKCNQM